MPIRTDCRSVLKLWGPDFQIWYFLYQALHLGLVALATNQVFFHMIITYHYYIICIFYSYVQLGRYNTLRLRF